MDTPIVPQKRCTKCGKTKPISQFNKRKVSNDGFSTSCKTCNSEQWKQYIQTHREQKQAYDRRYRHTHKEQIYITNSNWIKQNRKKSNALRRRWRRANLERDRENNRNHERRRRVNKLKIDGTHTFQQELIQLQHQKGRCYYCGKKLKRDWEADHVIPISRIGSTDDISNIVIACVSCNRKKRNKLPHEWPEGGRLL